ncbi:MAG: ABC transporter permease [Dehalococcoidales bacterium]|nr:ABC transporter permease [Dehalococcoidales bacterium]
MSVKRYFSSVITLMEFELRKIRHDSSQVWIRSVQPALWLLVFGEVFTKIKAIPTGDYTYLQFMMPGVLAQSVMFVAIFYGITIVWERDLGILNKLLASPAPRSAIVIGKTLSAGIRGIFQAIMVVILALIIQVKISLNPLHLLGVLVIIILFGMCFASLSLTLASLLKTRERVMGIGQAITMPLFFASSAIYPISIMPTWIKAIATINPLSYIVDALRRLLLDGYSSSTPFSLDILAIVLSTVVLVTAASLSFKRIVS